MVTFGNLLTGYPVYAEVHEHNPDYIPTFLGSGFLFDVTYAVFDQFMFLLTWMVPVAVLIIPFLVICVFWFYLFNKMMNVATRW